MLGLVCKRRGEVHSSKSFSSVDRHTHSLGSKDVDKVCIWAQNSRRKGDPLFSVFLHILLQHGHKTTRQVGVCKMLLNTVTGLNTNGGSVGSLHGKEGYVF